MVKRQRRMTVKKNTSKKAAPKVKPKQQGRRSSAPKPVKRIADTRANQAMKSLLKAIQNQTEEKE